MARGPAPRIDRSGPVKCYPAQLVLQDVLTLHGRQFRDVAAIVASPPCQRYSYMAQPWSRSKRLVRWQQWERNSPFGDGLADLNALFLACFRLQREASEAAGRRIPLVVENVKGAQPWVGPVKAHYGSYYLWGDVESVGGRIVAARPRFGQTIKASSRRASKPVGHVNQRDGYDHTRHLTNQRESDGVKQAGLSGPAWFNEGAAAVSSKSDSRKAASAMIAEIPFDLAQWVAKVLKPEPLLTGGNSSAHNISRRSIPQDVVV